MALVPANAAAGISIALQDKASIDATGSPTGQPPQGNFAAEWAAAYNDYASQGVVLGADNTGGDSSIIENAMSAVSSTPATVTALATALANYWATVAITPGAPAHGGTAVVSVSNNAASLISLFATAITASITSAEDSPWFETFVSNVQTIAVASIVWTVVELIPPTATPTPFPEVIT